MDDAQRETARFWIRQWRYAVTLQLRRISTPTRGDNWDVDIDFLHMATFRLIRACQQAGYPMEKRLADRISRVRHDVEHHHERDPSLVYFEGDDGGLSVWTLARGRGGEGEPTAMLLDVIDAAEAGIAHADMVLDELPKPTGSDHVELHEETTEALTDTAAQAIEGYLDEALRPNSDLPDEIRLRSPKISDYLRGGIDADD